jgi:hypothetical protein
MGIIAAMWTLPRRYDDIKQKVAFLQLIQRGQSCPPISGSKEYENCPRFLEL